MSYARTKVWVWFKDCVIPIWRISDKEPTDLKKGPAIPADAKCFNQTHLRLAVNPHNPDRWV